jgi:uncharacterized membrane protein
MGVPQANIARVWCALAALAFALPVLFGGASWYPGELSNFRNPLIGLCALTLLFLVVPAFRARAFLVWKDPAALLSDEGAHRLSVAFLVLFLGAFVKIALLNYASFSVHASDFSLFDHLIPNTARGRFMQSVPLLVHFPGCEDCNLFGQHAMPLLFVLYPLHRLFDDPHFFLLLHPIVLWSAAIPLYLMLRNAISIPLHRLLVLLAFLSSFGVARILFYNFHPEVFYLPVGFWLFYFVQRRRWAPSLVVAIFFLAIKEDAALYLGGLVIGLALVRRVPIWLAGALLALSAASFLVNSLWILPANWKAGPFHLTTYSKYGRSFAEIGAGMLAHWTEVLADIARGGWIPIAAAFLFLPLAYLPALLPMIPFVLLHSTSASAQMGALEIYYSAPLLPFLFLGFVETLRRETWPLVRRPFATKWKTALVLFALLYGSLFGNTSLFFRRPHPDHAHLSAVKAALRPGAPLCVDGSIVPHLGYEHLEGLTLLGPECIASRTYDYLLDPEIRTYPHSRVQVEAWARELGSRPGLHLRRYGGIHLFQRE